MIQWFRWLSRKCVKWRQLVSCLVSDRHKYLPDCTVEVFTWRHNQKIAKKLHTYRCCCCGKPTKAMTTKQVKAFEKKESPSWANSVYDRGGDQGMTGV